jgi:inosine-uridine nucleoside N-ribohydrolase
MEMHQYLSEMSVSGSCKLLLLIFFLAVFTPLLAEVNSSDLPLKVIFDTDLDSDVDDVGALAMLLNLHKSGHVDLLGVIVTSDDPYAPVCAAAINTFYGYPDIPVGFLKGQEKLTNHSRYTRQIANEFPADLKRWEDAECAVALYRKLLSESHNEAIYIVTVGHLTSLQQLIQSPPDQISPLNGRDLVNKKVKQWICMGGHYPSGKEANFYRPDPYSTYFCVNNWEKEVIFCGWEAGNPVITGGDWLRKTLHEGHPVYRGYELYNNFAGRQSWDQIAVLMLLDIGIEFFSFVQGECIVHPDGSNSWRKNPMGPHRYIVINEQTGPVKISRYIDRLMAGV